MAKDNVTSIKGDKPVMEAPKDLHGVVMDHAWRMDDLMRQLEKIHGKLDEHEKAAGGMVSAVMAIVDQRIDAKVKEAVDGARQMIRDELDRYKREDKAGDRKMIEDILSRHDEGEMQITKHGTVETPDGVHKMTVTEIRKRKPPPEHA